MSSWLASSITLQSDPRLEQLITPDNIRNVCIGIQSMMQQRMGVQTDLQDVSTVKQILMNVFNDLYPDGRITAQQMNQEAINRAYKVLISKYEMNQYYLGKIGYRPIPLPLPQNMSAYGLKPASEIYRGI
jgi:hypothetical protein